MWNQDEEAKEQEHIAVELNSVEEQQLSEIIREQTEKFKRSVTHKRQASTKFQDWAPGDVTYINLFCDGKMHRFGKASVMHTLWFFFVDLMIVLPLFVASVSSFVDAQSISAKFTTALKLNNMTSIVLESHEFKSLDNTSVALFVNSTVLLMYVIGLLAINGVDTILLMRMIRTTVLGTATDTELNPDFINSFTYEKQDGLSSGFLNSGHVLVAQTSFHALD